MKAFVWCVLLLFSHTVLAAQTPPAQGQDADRTATIRGTVTSAATGRPLRRVRVSLASATDRTLRPTSVHTNSSGRFEFRDVVPGSYYVSADRAGFLRVEYGQRQITERGLMVTVDGGETLERIDVALPLGGVLAGQILDERGEPYPGVRVDALVMRYRDGKRVPVPAGGGTTDDLGQYRIAGVPPGRYYVVATANETWRTAKGESWGYGSTYYPGGPPDRGQVIPLGPGEVRTDLSFALQAGRTVRVAGRVTNESGSPIPGGQVGLSYSYPGLIMVAGSRSVRAGADGTFEFKEVPPGTYLVGGGSAGETITVAGADVEGLLLVSRRGSTVTGTLTTDEGTPPPFPSSGVIMRLEAPHGDVLPTVRVVQVDEQWGFMLPNLGGHFLFRVGGLPPDWTLGSVRLDDQDITDVPFDVPTGGKAIAGLQVILTRRVSRVTGAVLDGQGASTTNGTIVIFSEDPAHWFPYSRYIQTARPQADGRFTIAGLPPGTYRAIVRDDLEPGQWEDREFLESVRDDGARFILLEGGSQALTLRLPAR